MAKAKLESLKVGTRFKYGSKSAVVLDKMDDGVLCIVVGENYRAVFDKESSSNFAKSTLYHELHEYRKQLVNSYLDKDHRKPVQEGQHCDSCLSEVVCMETERC